MPKPKPRLQTTTLWDYPSQQYRRDQEGRHDYQGATPAYLIWNLLKRYTRPKDLVVDPMAGSGTTLDVARDLNRRALGYDLHVVRPDVFRADARKLPLEAGKADFVFVDPPYSDHIHYSDDPRCIGKLSAKAAPYVQAMRAVIAEMDRILRPDRYLALFVADSSSKGQPLTPIGFTLFSMLQERFVPVDVVAVVRHHQSLRRHHWHSEAATGNYFLRGFSYLFILYKPSARGGSPRLPDRRTPEEVSEIRESFQDKKVDSHGKPGYAPPPPGPGAGRDREER